MSKCEVCGNEFEALRSTAKYCSDKCRKLAFLSVPAKDKVSVPNSLSVPDQTPVEVLSVPEVTPDTPARLSVKPETCINVQTDLKINLSKDLGVMGWTEDGIFIQPSITIDQARNIRRLIEAKNGWLHREYDGPAKFYNTSRPLVGVR